MKNVRYNKVILLLGVSLLFVFAGFSVTGCIKEPSVPSVINVYNHNTNINNITLNIGVVDTIIEIDTVTHDTVIIEERVTLTQFDSITSSWAKIDGVVEGSSLHSEFAYGVCWGTAPNPTVENNHSELYQFVCPDRFKIEIRNLKANTKYYVRPFLYKSNQYHYGKDSKDFTTNQ